MNEVFPFDISDIVFLLNLKIRRKNQTSWDCDCPFCGKEGKLNINLEKNVFRCNKCGEGGGKHIPRSSPCLLYRRHTEKIFWNAD